MFLFRFYFVFRLVSFYWLSFLVKVGFGNWRFYSNSFIRGKGRCGGIFGFVGGVKGGRRRLVILGLGCSRDDVFIFTGVIF